MALMPSGVKSGFEIDKTELLLRGKDPAYSRLERVLGFAGRVSGTRLCPG